MLYTLAMMESILKRQSIMFIVMVIIGMLFNPMNILAYRFSDLYISLTLFYGGLLMASNMIWGHEIVHYLHSGHFNIYVFFIGIALSVIVSTMLLRRQLYVNDNEWLKRMISHHSTALTTSHNIYNTSTNKDIQILAKTIIDTQEEEILQMQSLLSETHDVNP